MFSQSEEKEEKNLKIEEDSQRQQKIFAINDEAFIYLRKKLMFTLAFIYLLCETSHLSVNHNMHYSFLCIQQINF